MTFLVISVRIRLIMTEATTQPVKKRAVRTKKTALAGIGTGTSTSSLFSLSSVKSLQSVIDAFNNLTDKIVVARVEIENLQREIEETKENWVKEQKDHDSQIAGRNRQEETEKNRERETYDYETKLARKKAEDESADRKLKWEKELVEKKEVIEKDKQELEVLRKQVAGFEADKEKAVKEACINLQKSLIEKYEIEKKLREQEIKAEKELLSFKIEQLSKENSSQASEITHLQKSLQETSDQVKEIAVKVIESGSTASKSSVSSED